MSEAYLSLGSNMGDRMKNLSRAVALLDRPDRTVTVEQISPVFETKPVGYKEQDDFLNICVKVETTLEPLALLSLCNRIEEVLHRERTIRFGPRTIDVDILTYDDLKMTTQRLTIPHPRMQERGFVLVPLAYMNGANEVPEEWAEEVRFYGVLPKAAVD